MKAPLAEEQEEFSDDEPEVEDEPQIDAAVDEPKEEIDSNDFFCRFGPMRLDRMASALLGGELPVCERWISKDGKTAILRPMALSRKKPSPDFVPSTPQDLVAKWNAKFKSPMAKS